MSLQKYIDDYYKLFDINHPDTIFYDYISNKKTTSKQQFINRIKLFYLHYSYSINNYDIDNTLLEIFFMLYQCINLNYSTIIFYDYNHLIEIKYKQICINIKFFGSSIYKYIISYNLCEGNCDCDSYYDFYYNCGYCADFVKKKISMTSDCYNICSDDTLNLKIKSDFTKHVTWYKRLLPLYMSSDYASPNLLNLIPEDVSRYIISQYL